MPVRASLRWLLAAGVLAGVVVVVLWMRGSDAARSERAAAPKGSLPEVPLPEAEPPTTPAVEPAPDPYAERDWRLEVEVRDENNEPVSGRVYVTDAKGDLTSALDTEPPAPLVQRVRGTVSIVAYVWFYVPQFHENLIPPASGVRTVVVKVERGPGIAGMVVDDTGTPVTSWGTTLRARPLDPPSWLWRKSETWRSQTDETGRWFVFDAMADDDGSFSLQGLPPGRYEIQCQLSRLRSLDDPRPRALLAPEPVVATSGDADVRIVCQRPVEIHVRLFDLDSAIGIPPGTATSWMASNRHGLWQLGTAEGSTVRLEVPPAASFTLAVEAEGYHTPEPVLVAANREPGAQDVVVRLRRDPDAFSELELLVRDDVGEPAFPLWFGYGRRVEELSSAEGRYVLRLAAGPQRIMLRSAHRFKPEWRGGEIENVEPIGVYIEQELTVNLPRGGRVTRSVTLQRAGGIWVRLDPEDDFSDIKLLQGNAEQHPFMGLGEGKGIVAAVVPGTYTVEGKAGARVVRVEVEAKAAEVAEVWLRAESAK